MNYWLILGFTAQILFFMRFLIQWIVSEKKKESTIPMIFWYLSLAGGIGLLIYAIHIRDIVFIFGQSGGIFIYIRNIMLRLRQPASDKSPEKSDTINP
jgi:lipid-A-disaccharide synthase-like uncharacterized protein